MNSRRERPAGVLAGLTALFAVALGLVACEGSPEPPEFPLGEEPTAQPGGLTDAGGGSQSGMPPGLPSGSAPTGMTSAPGAQPGAAAGSTAGGDCCACTVTNTRTVDDPRLPCQFDIPGDWQVGLGRESGMLSAMAGRQSCDTICPSGMPSMSVSYGTQADANAATMQGIWKMGMREIGTAKCGDGTVTFYGPPVDADEREKLGGIKFYVNLDGKGYGGTALFSCGETGGWLRYRDLFIESFTDIPDSSFPE